MIMHPLLRSVVRIAPPLALAAASACAFFFPLAHDNLGETRVRAICHFAFACCTPIERSIFFNAPHRDEGACIDETLEDQGTGFLTAIDAQAKDAVARGTAVYDGEAAERCSRAQLDAVNSCDVEKLVDPSGGINFSALIFLADPNDPECVALATRNYVRGQVDNDDECLSSFDCKDFGSCVHDPDESDTLTTKGACVAQHAEDDDCSDGVPCQPGLACVGNGEAITCEQIEPAADGEPCSVGTDCESGNCQETIGDGTCIIAGGACVDDQDCPPDDFCNGDFTQECAAAQDVSIEICNGRD